MFCFKSEAILISQLVKEGRLTEAYDALLGFDPNIMNNSEVFPNVMKFYILKSKMLQHIFKGEMEAATASSVSVMDLLVRGVIPKTSEEERQEEMRSRIKEVTGSVSDLTEVDPIDWASYKDPSDPERSIFALALVNYLAIYCQTIFGCTQCQPIHPGVFQLGDED